MIILPIFIYTHAYLFYMYYYIYDMSNCVADKASPLHFSFLKEFPATISKVIFTSVWV